MTTSDDQSLTVISPAIGLTEFKADVKGIRTLLKKGMHKDFDYGTIPGTGAKLTLFQPGAEKLAKYFGLVPRYEPLKEIEDFEKGFIYYKVKCVLIHFKSGKHAGESIRSCNSKERSFAGKTAAESANNILARAQKRALVAAVRLATMASEIFVEGSEDDDEIAPGKPITKTEDPNRVRVLARFFATATNRGFSQDHAKSQMYKKYNVSSMTAISNQQLVETTEKLMATFDEVAPGEKPKMKPHEVVVEAEVVQPLDKVTITCYNCNKEVAIGNDPERFCNDTCKIQYWEKQTKDKEGAKKAAFNTAMLKVKAAKHI